jgi:hypothetical protein
MKRLLAYLKKKQSPDFAALADLQSFLNGIVGINHGGCGFAALVLYDCLIAHGRKAEIIFTYDPNDFDFNINQKCIETGNTNFMACSHALVKVGDFYVDSKGNIKNLKKNSHTMTRENTILALKNGNWNPSFLKSVYVPYIEDRVGYKLLDS